jgi:hypothetical protein
LFLPLGDFSSSQDIPEMYRHCKATEDKDMTVFDFVTDHLINIDGVFDKHTNGDEQKPHSPIQNQHVAQIITFQAISVFTFKAKPIYPAEKEVFPIQSDNYFTSDYISKIFRPPIFA